PDAVTMIMGYMDIPSLIVWRSLCHDSYAQVAAILEQDLEELLNAFIPFPRRFLALLMEHKAVIGGEFALSYLLRREDFDAARLDVFVSQRHFEALVGEATHSPFFTPYVRFETMWTLPTMFVYSRAVQRSALFYTSRARQMYIHESLTASPCSPIARTWCTALMNFVTAHTFGCAYPRLTFQRQGIVSDLRIRGLRPEDYQTLGRLAEGDFALAHEPTHLFAYAHLALSVPIPGVYRCLRELYICPDQARYFGDSGSMVVIIDTLRDGH
ncbi:hypothetical protein C8Q76DRAFT_566175, partial [Earliella scabrosa]